MSLPAKIRKTAKQRKIVASELNSIKDIQERIDVVAEDLNSNTCKYSILEGFELCEILGLDVDDNYDWGRGFYSHKINLDVHSGYQYPYAENVELLEGLIPKKRFKELSAQCDKMFSKNNTEELRDLLLSAEEIELIDQAYSESMARENGPDVTVIGTSLTTSSGDEIYFEAQIGCGGETYNLCTPYDLENGEGFDHSEYVEVE